MVGASGQRGLRSRATLSQRARWSRMLSRE